MQYNAEDDGTTDLLFAIAAPEDGGLHVDMLARMMQMLMNEDVYKRQAWYMLRTLNPNTWVWDGPDADYTPRSDDLPLSLIHI